MRARLQPIAFALGVIVALAGCFWLTASLAFSIQPVRSTPTPQPTIPIAVLQNIQPADAPPGVAVELIAENLDRPVAFAFAPDGRLFFTEKETGHVRVIIDDVLLAEPVLTLSVGIHAEQGLIGIAVDPNFESNHHLWVYHTLPAEANEGVKVNRIVRFTEQNNAGIEMTAVFTSTNSAGDGTHNSGNLVFGSDGKLYVSIGEDNEAYLAQTLDDPRGKILRFDPSVPLSAPEDNPFYDGDGPNIDAIYAYGFRNPFDFTFDPLSDDGRIFATENGPSCDDEIDLVRRGYNYGWHLGYDCDDEKGLDPDRNSIAPLLHWSPTTAPTGIAVYTGNIEEWYGDVFFCSYIDARLHHLKLNAARDAFISHTSINGMFCQTDVFNGPDGALYFLEGGGFEQGTLKRLVHHP